MTDINFFEVDSSVAQRRAKEQSNVAFLEKPQHYNTQPRRLRVYFTVTKCTDAQVWPGPQPAAWASRPDVSFTTHTDTQPSGARSETYADRHAHRSNSSTTSATQACRTVVQRSQYSPARKGVFTAPWAIVRDRIGRFQKITGKSTQQRDAACLHHPTCAFAPVEP